VGDLIQVLMLCFWQLFWNTCHRTKYSPSTFFLGNEQQ